MYLLDDLAPLNFLLTLIISEQLLCSLNTLDLGRHRQVLLYQLHLMQITKSLIDLHSLLLFLPAKLRPLSISLGKVHPY